MNLPVIQHHRFTEEELQACQRGECCRCGVCCTAFLIREVPSIPGDASSPMKQKEAGVPCPQLTVLPDGTMGCLIHDDPLRPDVCKQWKGDLEDGHYRYSNLKDRAHAQALLFPKQNLGILAAEHAILTGTVSRLTLRIIQNSIHNELRAILKAHLLRCQYYSALVMETIGMKKVLHEEGWTRENTIASICLHQEHPEHRRFLDDHFPHNEPSHVRAKGRMVGRAGLEPAKA